MTRESSIEILNLVEAALAAAGFTHITRIPSCRVASARRDDNDGFGELHVVFSIPIAGGMEQTKIRDENVTREWVDSKIKEMKSAGKKQAKRTTAIRRAQESDD